MRFILIPYLFLHTVLLPAQTWDSLNASGLKLYNEGHYSGALHNLQAALRVAEKEAGKLSVPYSTTLTNLGFLYKAMGNYPAAAGMFGTTIALADRQYKQIHLDQIEARVNLANLMLETGQYDSCEVYLQICEGLIKQASVENPEHYVEFMHQFNMVFVNVHNALASLKRRKGQVPEAIAILESLVTFIKAVYPGQYDSLEHYRSLLSNLGNYYMQLGNPGQSKKLNAEYMQVIEKHEDDRLSYLFALQNMGNIYRLLDQPDSAIYSWQKALAYFDQGRYAGSELHLSILNNLGELYSSLEDYEQGIKFLLQACALNETRGGINPRQYQTSLFNLAVSYQWSSQYARADEVYARLIDHLLNEVRHNFTYLSENEKIAFYRSQLEILESFLFFALEVSGTGNFQSSDHPYINPAITRQLYDLQVITKGIILNASHKMKNQILQGSDEQLKQDYTLWELQKNELATRGRSGQTSKLELAQLAASIETLEIKLSRNSAQFKRGFVVNPVSWKEIQQTLKPGEAAVEMIRFVGGLIYGALIITPETKIHPVMALVKSKENRFLEKEYFKQYANAVAYQIEDTLSYQVYWKPILNAIREQLAPGQSLNRVYFSPDGIYNQLNLNTLFDASTNQYVLDQVEIHQLTNTKELLSKESIKSKTKSKTAILVGRPAFTLDSPVEVELFTDLSGTEKEVNSVAGLLAKKKWNTRVYKGKEAREETVKQLQSVTVLHLATHGFFDRLQHEGSANSLIQILLNSGIALAGANQPHQLDGEDGILTAYEALNLNLDKTQLVVLSACETGLGEFFPGEGVYGLRIALTSAGADNIIMSLWKVDDEATQQLMTLFYREWLNKPSDMRGSFRKAQQELRKIYPQPFYWGAFVLSGN